MQSLSCIEFQSLSGISESIGQVALASILIDPLVSGQTNLFSFSLGLTITIASYVTSFLFARRSSSVVQLKHNKNNK